MEELLELLKRRGFVWPSFEIYGGVAGFYDFGPLGALLRDNLISEWKKHYVQEEGSLLLETPTVVPFEVLKASGHVNHFTDLMWTCSSCGESFRLSDLVKDRFALSVEGMSREELERFLASKKLTCPNCGSDSYTLSDFNIMFQTSIGPKMKQAGFLRPETAQQIFIAFRRLFRQGRGKLPLAVATVGKGYRNEISPRQGLIRLREFTMAEVEVFFDPEHPRPPTFDQLKGEWLKLHCANGEEVELRAGEALDRVCNEMMAYHMALAKRFLIRIGIPEDRIRFREQPPAERAHYSAETWDMEVETRQFGWVEVAGIAYRTDYDLSRHSSHSGEDLSVTIDGRKIYPHVVEPSFGIDRIFYCLLEHSFKKVNGRKVLALKPQLAPVKLCVLPLVSKDGLPEKAREIFRQLRTAFHCEYDESGSIGRRYMRADEAGVPYCITIDYDSLKDGSVTIRDRDTALQVRVKGDLISVVSDLLSGRRKFQEVGVPVQRSQRMGSETSVNEKKVNE